MRHNLAGSFSLRNKIGEAFPLEVFHGDEILAILTTEIENLNYIGMIEMRRDTGFVEEHLEKSFVSGKMRKYSLDDYQTIETLDSGLAGKIDFRHAAGCEQSQELIAPQPFWLRSNHIVILPVCENQDNLFT